MSDEHPTTTDASPTPGETPSPTPAVPPTEAPAGMWARQAWRAATGRRLGDLPEKVGPAALPLALLAYQLLALAGERLLIAGGATFSLPGWLYGVARRIALQHPPKYDGCSGFHVVARNFDHNGVCENWIRSFSISIFVQIGIGL